MDINDDEMTDRLDYLSDKYANFFLHLEMLLDFDMQEPSPAELAMMDENANALLQDIIGDSDEQDSQ